MRKLLHLIIGIFFLGIIEMATAQEMGELLRFQNSLALDVTTAPAERSGTVLFASPQSDSAREPFNRVLLNGMVSDSHLVLQVRIEMPDGRWSDWQEMYRAIFPNGRFWARYDLPEGTTRRIQLRVLSAGKTDTVRLQIFAVEALLMKDESLLPESPRSPVPPARSYQPQDTIPYPAVVTRQQWGANPPLSPYVPHSPYRLTLHHTAGTRVATLQDGIAEMQFIQHFHQYGRGWPDIGYHFCIDDSGRIYEGVPHQYQGTHVGGNNYGNVGISYMGNFHLPGEFPTPQALDSYVAIWSWLCFHYGINPDSLYGHRDYKATACPGDNLYPELPTMRNNIRRLLGFGAPYVVNPFPQPFSRGVSRITPIAFGIRDDVEGVDLNSLIVRLNGDTIAPLVSGTPNDVLVQYQPPQPFPYSQNVQVYVTASDLATPPDSMSYTYQFQVEVEAVYLEMLTASSMRNAQLQITGTWQQDNNDVQLSGLLDGIRLIAVDTDSSHTARIFPVIAEEGDYRVLMATSERFLGESAHYRFVSPYGRSHPHFAEYNSVYYQQWSPVSPTPVHFSPDPNNSGYIELSGVDSLPTRLVLDAFRLERVDRLDPPHAPTLKWVKIVDPATREIEVAWYPTLEGDIAGYRLFVSDDALTWGAPLVDEQVLTAAHDHYRFSYSGNQTTVYFRVVAVDTNKFYNELGVAEPLLSLPSDAYGVGFSGTTRILIVDNFDRMASWHQPYHPFVASYGEALAENGYGFESCTETAVQNGDIALNDYDVVIYFCGDDSRTDESLAAADQWRLLDYLEQGGKLFISGSEIGYDFADTTPDELARYEYLLKAEYAGDLSGSNHVLGAAGTPFDGLDFVFGTMSGPNLYFEDYPDYLLPKYGSEMALMYDNLRIAGLQFTGTYGNSPHTAQLVYLGFTFETIITPEDRAAVMGAVLNYLGYPTAIRAETAAAPHQFVLFPNYPNPFNPTTRIQYAISGKQMVELQIFDLLGREVKTLVKEEQSAGTHVVEWDGTNQQGEPVASGIYLYRLRVREPAPGRKIFFHQTRKMMLLR